ncbi:conserved hypothetical protein [Candidatus Roizmanbacteria bacterium]|nr:conserved hypothetical protein [Candidatus Roizmanbacteria bacterium]
MSLGGYRYGHNKIEMAAHSLKGTEVIAKTEAGPIYRMPLNIFRRSRDILLPEEVSDIFNSDIERNRVVDKLHNNHFEINHAFGRPSSAFIVHLLRGFVIDFLEVQNKTRGNRQPHDFIRQNVNYQQALPIPISPHMTSLSGHIAPLTISTSDMIGVFLFDVFSGPSPNLYHEDVSELMNLLRGNRILPITADGYIINN